MGSMKDTFGDDLFQVPSQSHSRTSVGAARTVSRKRESEQEKWIFEALQTRDMADWQIWEIVKDTNIFDKETSCHRARIGLVWVSRKVGPSPYHPVEASGRESINPASGKPCTIWRFRSVYAALTYSEWVRKYKKLAKEWRG